MSDPLDAVSESVFPVARAVAAGLATSRARRHDLVAVSRGLRRRRDVPAAPLDVALAHARRDRSLVVSHASAAQAWGMWLPAEAEQRVHLSRVRPGAQPRIAGVAGHRIRIDPVTGLTVLGVGDKAYTVTTPERTWTDLASMGLTREDLIVAGDALLRRRDGPGGEAAAGRQHPLSSLADLGVAVAEARGVTGWRLLGEALPHLRERSDSPQETRLRVRLVGAGFPEPQVNPEVPLVWDAWGRILRSTPVDLYFAAAKVALQFEGEHHFSRARQYRRDMRRDEELRDVGVETVRVDSAVFGAGEWARFMARLQRLLTTRGGA